MIYYRDLKTQPSQACTISNGVYAGAAAKVYQADGCVLIIANEAIVHDDALLVGDMVVHPEMVLHAGTHRSPVTK